MLYLTLLLISLAIVLFALRRRFTHWARQGVNSYSFISTGGWLEEQHRYTLKMFDKYGSIYGGYTLAFDFLVINKPEMIKEVFVKNFHIFPNHPHINLSPLPKVSKMLFFMPGDDNWKRVRSIITPVFTSSKLKSMMSQISEISDEFVKKLDGIEKKGEEVDMRQYLGAFSMDVISGSAFGIKIDSINNPDHPIVLNANKILSVDVNLSMITSIFFPKLASWLRLNFFDIDAINFLDEMIKEIKIKRQDLIHELENNPEIKKRTDFIQLMLDLEDPVPNVNDLSGGNNKTTDSLSPDEMTAQAIIFLIAGYDTTTTALCHVVYYLAENKDCQQRLYEELKDVKEFSYENLSRLKYLNAVIDETLRLSPPVLRIQRQSIENFELDGIKIPAGTFVEVCPYALHRDPELWTDPLEFKPDRFFESTHHPYAYLPFGGGPRLCLGQRFALNEMRICCAKLFSRFEFSLSPGFKPEYFKGNIILSPKNMLVTLKTR